MIEHIFVFDKLSNTMFYRSLLLDTFVVQSWIFLRIIKRYFCIKTQRSQFAFRTIDLMQGKRNYISTEKKWNKGNGGSTFIKSKQKFFVLYLRLKIDSITMWFLLLLIHINGIVLAFNMIFFHNIRSKFIQEGLKNFCGTFWPFTMYVFEEN